MKFFWKAFISFFVMIAIAFGVCGTWMIQASFNSNYERELDRRLDENDMYRRTFISSIESFAYYGDSNFDSNIKNVVQSLLINPNEKNNSITVWDMNHDMVFSNDIEPVTNLIDTIKDNQKAYMVLKKGDNYKLHVISCITLYGEYAQYYIETITDVNSIYKQRDDMLRLYHFMMVILLVVCGLVCAFISYVLTNRISLLSRTARRVAKGDMEVRARVSGKDEVAMLAEDFNTMADSLNDKMNQIEQHAKNQEAFTSSFAHELKTPLTAIIGYAEILSSMHLDHEEMVKASGYIYSQGRRLESLSYKLMELFFIREQKLEFHNISATYLLQCVYDLVEIGLMNKDIKLIRSFQKGSIYGEKDLLISLFSNVIDNARKASESGSKIYFKGIQIEEGYKVIVTDEGKGIPEEEIEHLQEAFYMVDKSRARKEGGAGLGMTLCKEIVNVHGAEWKIESEIGKGTTVTIVFPKHKEANVVENDEEIG